MLGIQKSIKYEKYYRSRLTMSYCMQKDSFQKANSDATKCMPYLRFMAAELFRVARPALSFAQILITRGNKTIVCHVALIPFVSCRINVMRK